MPAYAKRWKAALASAKITDLVLAESWFVTGPDELRREVVDRVLALEKAGAEWAVLAQIKLVWEFSSLKTVQYMDLFVKSQCRALEIPSVLNQKTAAVELGELSEDTKRQLIELGYPVSRRRHHEDSKLRRGRHQRQKGKEELAQSIM
ncbi:hypothetical protein PYW08_005984 [Mythimna loreyi]|uniref:Uncharacterized protein n=1 Tax=Mythimna loreyi TaxID=667449 RepID=A0ACC2QLD0_9NEOP|nr:hypothetical protein PYW08_005984 [Mythimna loreyi]